MKNGRCLSLSDYREYFRTQETLTLPMEISERVHNLCMIYSNDLSEIVLLKELGMLSSMVGPVKNISELKEKMKNTSSALDKFLPNVHTLLRLSCLIPVTTATSERSFSALRRKRIARVRATHRRASGSGERLYLGGGATHVKFSAALVSAWPL